MEDEKPPNLPLDLTLAGLQRHQLLFRLDHLSESTKSKKQSLNPEPICTQEGINAKEWLIRYRPVDLKELLFVLVAVVCLIIGVIHFFRTGDTTMLIEVLSSVGAYAGLKELKDFASKRKKGEANP